MKAKTEFSGTLYNSPQKSKTILQQPNYMTENYKKKITRLV